MKTFAKNIEDRKVLVKRLTELTGEPSHYTRVPRYAYEIGAFTVEKDGTLTVSDDADESIIETLLAEDLILDNTAAEEAEQEDIEETEPETAEETEQEVTEVTELVEEEAEPTPETEEEEADNAEDTEPEVIEEDESTETATEEEDTEENGFPMDASISFPLAKHTANSILNLVSMIFSRGPLLTKATGGEFRVDKELVDGLLNHATFCTSDEVIGFIREWDGNEHPISGLSFDDEKLTIDGFKAVKDAEHLQTYTKLAAAMNQMALTQKRVQAKDVDDSNEKYALRIWLIRLGMNGADYKAERKILMENLSGHTAFRNEEEKERWMARQQAKKEALKAAKEEALA